MKINRVGILIITALILQLAISQDSVPAFIVDFDLPPSQRYNEVWTHFKDSIIKMENMFYYSVAPKYRDYFQENAYKFKDINPHVYFAMESLSNITGIEIHQAILVNSIVDFSSFCTSIVARMENGTIIHARNLDFDFPSLMNSMVYNALYKKNGTIIAEAPSIAGYIGAYTGLRYGIFTVSYNVRQLRNMSNIEQNLISEFEGVVPSAQLIQEVLLTSTSYNESVFRLSNDSINTPCYIIVGGVQPNEGIVLARDRDGLNFSYSLSNQTWFVAQTNMDHWIQDDGRYTATVSAMSKVGLQNINPVSIVFDVLRSQGVLQSITIFQASLSASLSSNEIYIVPQPKIEYDDIIAIDDNITIEMMTQ